MAKRKPNKHEREHMNRVADLGCIACLNIGYPDSPAELHHPRTGQGMGQRASHYDVIPLCPSHHRTGGPGIALHAGQAEFTKKYGTEKQLLQQVREILNV
jgi:hypothetical protein